MNLQTLFRNPFASSVRIPKDVSLTSLIDPYSIYKEEANSSALLLQVLAKAEAHAHFPWTFDMLPTSCSIFAERFRKHSHRWFHPSASGIFPPFVRLQPSLQAANWSRCMGFSMFYHCRIRFICISVHSPSGRLLTYRGATAVLMLLVSGTAGCPMLSA